jgi:hypothetical protein
MRWDEISALAALSGTLVVFVGSVAAIVQLKHLRLTYQIESYVDLMGRLNSPEMVAAREYVETLDFHDPALLEQALSGGADHRLLMYGGFYQMVARLINLGIADRDLFAAIVMTSPQVWKKLGPLAYAWRERHPSNPRWADLECLVFEAVNKPPVDPRKFSAAFRTRIQLDRALEAWRVAAEDALSRS